MWALMVNILLMDEPCSVVRPFWRTTITKIKSLDGYALGAKITEVVTMNAPSTTFWRQDVNRYVQQQDWTRSFRQVDQNWDQKLSSGTSPGSATAAPAGESESASIISPNAFDSQP